LAARAEIGQADVTRWGVTAIAAAGVAVLSVSLSGLVPHNMAVGLHSTRLDGGNVNLLREQVAHLRTQQDQLTRGNTELESQVRLTERDQGELGRRMAALESAVPLLLEAIPPEVEIDRSLATGSVEDEKEPTSMEAEGGSVSFTHSPLFAGSDLLNQPLPAAVEEEPDPVERSMASETRTPEADIPAGRAAQGMALGELSSQAEVVARWPELRAEVGTLLLGLQPFLAPETSERSRLVLGPLGDPAEAQMLCGRIVRLDVPCLPVEYDRQTVVQLEALSASN